MTQTSALDELLAEDLADPEGRALHEEIAVMVDFGMALAIARTERKRSLRTLAEITGISHATLRDLEKGNAAPTLLMQKKIAQALNARIEIGAKGLIHFVLFPQPTTRRDPARFAGARTKALVESVA